MKYFYIDARIDEKMLQKFFDFCNANPDDDWIITLWTNGGFSTASAQIISMINTRPDKVILVCHEAYSAGFDIFYRAKCKKIICATSKGMWHLATVSMTVDSRMKPVYTEDKTIVKNWKENKKSSIQFAEQFLTKKEFKRFKKGYDIYFTAKRMKEIFPDAIII